MSVSSPAEAMRARLSPNTSYFELDSRHVGDRFGIWITLPPRYEREARAPYSVVYVTDGNTSALIAAAAAFLVLGDHLRPARGFVQVCIGYTEEDVGRRMIRRNRDFLPPDEPYSVLQERHVQAKAYAGALGEDGMREFLHFAGHGRADLFLRFIEEEATAKRARAQIRPGDWSMVKRVGL
jgi:predicted alpha/beta superfamily hydrolase